MIQGTMFDLKTIIVMALLSLCVASFDMKSQTFSTTKNIRVLSNGQSSKTTKARSRIECSVLCTSDDNCFSSSYATNLKVCTLFLTCHNVTEYSAGSEITIKTQLNPGPFPADCSHLPDGTVDGVYQIFVNNDCINIYCDMVDKWTVIQRRQDGSTDFYRDWLDYKNGFGDLSGEYWLGNDNIFNILNGKSYSLRFDLEDWSGERRYAQYETFSIADESAEYQLTLAGYSGDASDSMLGSDPALNLNGKRFSTKDRDNDDNAGGQCALVQKGGWWYKWCTYANPNGLYFLGTEPDYSGIYWYKWNTSIRYYRMKSVTMKIKRLP